MTFGAFTSNTRSGNLIHQLSNETGESLETYNEVPDMMISFPHSSSISESGTLIIVRNVRKLNINIRLMN